MEENKNVNRSEEQQGQPVKLDQATPDKNDKEPAGLKGAPNQMGSGNAGEKKIVSHKTGDASNFGDRSYQED